MRFLQVRIPLGPAQLGLDPRPLVVGEVRWISTAPRRILRLHIRFRSQPEETRKFLWNTFLGLALRVLVPLLGRRVVDRYSIPVWDLNKRPDPPVAGRGARRV